MITNIVQKLLENSLFRERLNLYMSNLSPNQICSISDGMPVKKFAKLLQTLFRAWWIAARFPYQATK